MGKGLKCSPTANSSRRAVSPTDTPEIAFPLIDSDPVDYTVLSSDPCTKVEPEAINSRILQPISYGNAQVHKGVAVQDIWHADVWVVASRIVPKIGMKYSGEYQGSVRTTTSRV